MTGEVGSCPIILGKRNVLDYTEVMKLQPYRFSNSKFLKSGNMRKDVKTAVVVCSGKFPIQLHGLCILVGTAGFVCMRMYTLRLAISYIFAI